MRCHRLAQPAIIDFMDEQTFRRLAPDAVAGRLDTAVYERWKDAAGESPERAPFVVRIAEADARLSGSLEPIRPVEVHEPAKRIPRAAGIGLGVFFGAFGLLAGALVMHSYLGTQQRTEQAKSSVAPMNAPVNQPANVPANTPATAINTEPAANEPEPDPEPEPEPEPPQQVEGLHLRTGASGLVSVRGVKDDRWRKLEPNEALKDGDSVSHNEPGAARFVAPGLRLDVQGPALFEFRGGVIRFTAGRAGVHVSSSWRFSCYKSEWSAKDAAFVVEPKPLGGELSLLSGVIAGDTQVVAPVQLLLDGTGRVSPLGPAQISQLEHELLGAHETLLHWDFETPAGTPVFSAVVSPGALGDGHAGERKAGDPGIGMPPSSQLFVAGEGSRLRLRVNTGARRLRIEFRVQLEEGFRLVDALLDVPPGEGWQIIDTPLEGLRAGRYRDEPGWIPGQPYSAFVITTAPDPDQPLTRYQLRIDDLLIYTPE